VSAPICLITGATEGVGRATAIELGRVGFEVVLLARNREKAEETRRAVLAVSRGPRCDYLVGDLASLTQVRKVGETFRTRYPRLDVLINNAGVFLPIRTQTEDGYETAFQVNYLSHFLLTQLLLETLSRSPQGRVVNLSSSVYSVGRFEPDNLQSERKFSVLGTYAASKLMTLMSTEELAARLAGTRITANAVHPGIVRTRMMLAAPGAFKLMSYLSIPFSISPEEGARTSVFVASASELASVTGRYFVRSRPAPVRNRYDTAENRARLWDLSMKAIGRANGAGLPLASN
jgi:retinol dehydrogenase-12